MSQRLREVWNRTREACERGSYRVGGRDVDLTGLLAVMRTGTRLHLPEDTAGAVVPEGGHHTRFEVTGESTLEAVRRLAGRGRSRSGWRR
ncbi:hypothetical protein GCM10007079_41020 [Nocardiopsis terrae]|uniref:Microbial-type PARG catalytic domain-containing protein n=1 Tax=Nocardiopsis terrae TaxID=372655 RepID=A0ABR9HAI1_9ACTN|nr:poly(ADP-ribose) glycohydrolase domain-containing protein [Nocardiopsis terrae]MBE1455805.1 hypothetical protein [Nocardiopsis terrae]GHC92616.1 hypothetical protein GCM10007079_41020 [Nocardiopsis terrae]